LKSAEPEAFAATKGAAGLSPALKGPEPAVFTAAGSGASEPPSGLKGHKSEDFIEADDGNARPSPASREPKPDSFITSDGIFGPFPGVKTPERTAAKPVTGSASPADDANGPVRPFVALPSCIGIEPAITHHLGDANASHMPGDKYHA
jgi:hypothetical protein